MTESLDQKHATSDAGVPPLPHHNRKPKAREVSSRFMSPVVAVDPSPSSSSPKHAFPTTLPPSPAESHSRHHHHQRSKTVLLHRYPQEQEPLFCCADETSRSWDTPLRSHNRSLSSSSLVVRSLQRKPRAAVKLYKENGEGSRAERKQQNPDVLLETKIPVVRNVTRTPSSSSSSLSRSRPDTPQVGMERIIPSRFRLSTQNFQCHTNIGINAGVATTAAAKLLQSSGLSMSADPSCRDSKEEASFTVCDDHKSSAATMRDNNNHGDLEECIAHANSNSIRACSMLDVRSCMPVGDMLLVERNCKCSSSKTSACTSLVDLSHFSKLSHSLNLPPSSFTEHSSLKTNERSAVVSVSLLSRTPSAKMGGILLPPNPNCMKLGAADAIKGRKMVFTPQDDVHALKLLHNKCLQWRYANAKAELSMRALKREKERKICSLGVKILDLREAVTRNRIELARFIRTRTLLTILEANKTYLDEWSALEEEYSTSLSGAIHSLVNSSLRLPVSGHVQADTKEIMEALNSATKMIEMMGIHVNRFIPQAKELDCLISELGRVVGGERSLIKECGDLLFKDCASQVEDCSLRGHIMQLQRNDCFQFQEEEMM